MQPKEIVLHRAEALRRPDADALAAFYSDDAINHQVAEIPKR